MNEAEIREAVERQLVQDPDEGAMHVHVDDLRRVLEENQRLRARERELLANNTSLVIENRNLRAQFASVKAVVRADDGSPIEFSSILRSQVSAFMHAFDQPVREKPSVPAEKIVRLRAELILEEAFEFVCACTGKDTHHRFERFQAEAIDMIRLSYVHVQLPAVADALADLAYVTEGAWLSFGISPQPVLDEVHRSNMAKLGGGVDPTTGKKLKPSGWTPPNVAGVLLAQGWENGR